MTHVKTEGLKLKFYEVERISLTEYGSTERMLKITTFVSTSVPESILRIRHGEYSRDFSAAL